MRDIDDYERRYEAGYEFERVMVEFRRRCVLASLSRFPHATVLEVGCGLEPLFAHLDPAVRVDVVEPGERFFAHAQTLAADRPSARLFRGTLEEVAAQLGAYDFIVVSGLLHEVEHPAELLRVVRSLAGPETVVHINVPNADSLHVRIGLEMNVIADRFERSDLAKALQRHSTFDLESLTRLVVDAGFDVLDHGTYFLKPFTHGQMAAMLRERIIDDSVLEALNTVVRHLPGLGAELYVNLRTRRR